ncbi:MAG: hypothetical protein H6Q72_4350 [Firmicutes bacterium]|nr:hypothetical protein [Bacillota bacterium]
MLDGYQWRENHDCERQAYFTAAMMSVHTKKPVKPTDLWKPLKQKKAVKCDKKAEEAHLRKVFGL